MYGSDADLEAEDQRRAAPDFMRERFRALQAS
jgi:hypothetical protein